MKILLITCIFLVGILPICSAETINLDTTTFIYKGKERTFDQTIDEWILHNKDRYITELDQYWKFSWVKNRVREFIKKGAIK